MSADKGPMGPAEGERTTVLAAAYLLNVPAFRFTIAVVTRLLLCLELTFAWHRLHNGALLSVFAWLLASVLQELVEIRRAGFSGWASDPLNCIELPSAILCTIGSS